MVHSRPAVVSIFADGSVMVTTAGAELGQGMFTKVKQVCAPIQAIAGQAGASFLR